MYAYIIQTESLMHIFIILFSLHNLCIRVKIGFVTNMCHLQEMLGVVHIYIY